MLFLHIIHIHVHLGARYEPAGPKDFCSGDRVKCDVDVEILSLASEVGEGANDQILMVCA